MRMLIVGAAAVAAVALAGCGSAKDSGSPVPGAGAPGQPGQPGTVPAGTDQGGGLDGIVDASRKAGTAKLTSSIEAEVGGNKLTVSSGEGAVDFANKRSTMSMKMADPRTGAQGGGTNVIIDGSAGYLQYLVDGQPGPWMKFDLTAMVGQRGVSDMGTYLTLMAGITQSSEVGKETVHGADTTHYSVTVDPGKILEKYPEMKEFISSMLKLAESVAPGSSKGVEEDANKPAQYDLWVGKGGLIYRITQEFDVKGDNGQDVTGRSTTEFFDYGKPVDIAPPPAGAVKNGG
jgi:hypothetical protein